MKLTLKYIAFYRFQSFVIILFLTVIFAVPIVNSTLSQAIVQRVEKRSESIPVVISNRGGKIKETLTSLFFMSQERNTTAIKNQDLDTLEGKGESVPLFLKYQTKVGPLVGTDLDFFSFHNYNLKKGDLFAFPGDVVIGADLASQKKLKLGSLLKVQSQDAYSLNKSAPIPLTVVGILNKTNSPDDSAVFANLQTTWILEGILHGHDDEDKYKQENNKETVYSKSLKVHSNTEEKLLSFHFHGDPDSLPLTRILFRGTNHKQEVLVMDQVNNSPRLMAFRPRKPLSEILSVFFKVEEIFKAYHVFWSLCSLLMLFLVFSFVYQRRKNEFKTLIDLGGSQYFVFKQMGLLVLICIVISLSLSLFISGVIHSLLRNLHL